MKGLSECKASESNVRRIQVKDIVKEVEDHLKTYSSAEMDISWRRGAWQNRSMVVAAVRKRMILVEQ
ncbi:hypothetical protein Tco_0300138 [Tanacetum coccineum]